MSPLDHMQQAAYEADDFVSLKALRAALQSLTENVSEEMIRAGMLAASEYSRSCIEVRVAPNPREAIPLVLSVMIQAALAENE